VSLVTSSNIGDFLGDMDRVGDFWRLLFQSHNYLTGVVVASFVCVIVADLLEGVAYNLLVVYDGLGGDFTENHDHIGLGAGLTCHSRIWILGETGIKDCVRDLIAELIRVSFIDTF